MSSEVVPKEIQHLDFIPGADDAVEVANEEKPEEPKPCVMPVGHHPYTNQVLRCNAPSDYIIKWKIGCAHKTISGPVCSDCWSGRIRRRDTGLQCSEHTGNKIDMVRDMISMTPLKKS